VTVQADHLVLTGAGAPPLPGPFPTAGILSLAEGGSTGNTGVVVQANQLVIDGREAQGVIGIGSLANPGSSGNTGDTRVLARELEVLNGATISSSNLGAGRTGAVSVQAGHLVLSGVRQVPLLNFFPGSDFVPSSIANAAPLGATGAAGDVQVRADTLELRAGGSSVPQPSAPAMLG
jgi:hypothetical protein